MHFTKFTLLSIVALATALPNAIPEPEPAQLEARTWGWNWYGKNCDCTCNEHGNYPRSLETRTIWHLPNLSEKLCQKQCKKKCDDYYDGKSTSCHFYSLALCFCIERRAWV